MNTKRKGTAREYRSIVLLCDTPTTLAGEGSARLTVALSGVITHEAGITHDEP